MEKNPDSQQPEFCVNNCGFYGNPIYNNMCSKCFKEQQQKQNTVLQQQQQQQVDVSQTTKATAAIQTQAPAAAAEAATIITTATTPAVSTAVPVSAAAAAAASAAQTPAHIHNPLVDALIANTVDSAAEILPSSAPGSHVQTPLVPLSPSPSGSSTPTKRTQANKGRCFKCRSRVPLVKQTTNKCRCEHVFCDTHRFPDQHNCEFDFMTRDRKDLEKRNPKINDHPKGGRSFTRID